MKDKNSFINKRLEEYSEDSNFEDYKQLIQYVKDGSDIDAKYNLLTLLIEYTTEQLCVGNLQTRLSNIFCSDENIEEYLNNIVKFNP